MHAVFSHCRVDAVIGAVPRSVSFFDDEIQNYPQDRASSLKLKEVMGYGEHRVVDSDITTYDLAQACIDELITRGLLRAEEVGAVYFVSQTPEYILPPTSSKLHGHFNFSINTYCADINDGCNGYIKGLFEALSFLTIVNSGCAILIAGDVLSPLVSRRDRNSYPLIGDGATVTILRRDKNWTGEEVTISIQNDGHGFDKLIVQSGGARQRLNLNENEEPDAEGNVRSSHHLRMNGRDVFAFTQTVVPPFLQEVMTSCELNSSDIDRFYLHQANAFIIDRLRKKMGASVDQMPDRVIRKYGNSSSGTIPMLIASEPNQSKVMHCLLGGFGVGLSWGASVLKLQPTVPQGVLEI